MRTIVAGLRTTKDDTVEAVALADLFSVVRRFSFDPAAGLFGPVKSRVEALTHLCRVELVLLALVLDSVVIEVFLSPAEDESAFFFWAVA